MLPFFLPMLSQAKTYQSRGDPISLKEDGSGHTHDASPGGALAAAANVIRLRGTST